MGLQNSIKILFFWTQYILMVVSGVFNVRAFVDSILLTFIYLMTNSFLRIPWEHIIASCPIAIVYDRCGIQSHITCEIKQINIHSLLLPLNNGVPVESSYHEYITPTHRRHSPTEI